MALWSKEAPIAPATSASIAKAQRSPSHRLPEPVAWELDPFTMANAFVGEIPFDTHPGTIGLPYETLMGVSRVAVIGAIIQTRIQQVAEFCRVPANRYQVGFRAKLRDPRAKATRAAEKEIKYIERIILEAGGKHGPGGMEMAIRMLVRDSLTYDQGTAEILETKVSRLTGRRGAPVGWVPCDAATIRRSRPGPKALKVGRRDPEAAFVQVINNQIVNEWPQERMLWGIRRPRTWIHAQGYGFPEIEELMMVVTDLVNAQTYNSVAFTNGIHTSTLMTVKATMDRKKWSLFKRTMISQLTGVRQSKRLPMIQLDPKKNESIEKVDLGMTPQDMEFSNFINFLLKLACACWSMDSAELNFVFGNEGQGGGLNQSSPMERIQASKERGLRPLLRSIEGWLNHWIVEPIDEDFGMEFVGLDARSEADQIDLDVKTMGAFKAMNEVRAEHDLKPIKHELADLPMNQTFITAYTQEKEAERQQKMQEEQEQQGGEEGFDDEGGGGDDMPDLGLDEQQEEQLAASMGSDQGFDKFSRDAVDTLQKSVDEGRLEFKGTARRGVRRAIGRRGKHMVVVEVR